MNIDLKQGDCLELMKGIPCDSIHAVISDIPYGISFDCWDVIHDNKNSALGGSSPAQEISGSVFKRRGKPLNGWSEADKNNSKQYQEWCSKWGKECYRVLMPGSSCFIFAGRRYAHRCITALEDLGFTFKDMLGWNKNRACFKAQRVSEVFKRRNDLNNAEKWEGWRLGNLSPEFEPVLWFQKPYKIGGTLTDNLLKYNVGAFYSPGKKSNIFCYDLPNKEKAGHPTQKPVSLLEDLMSISTLENQTVLDPFMGSGSTGVACVNTNRNFIGIELDDEYFEIAKKRIREAKEKIDGQ